MYGWSTQWKTRFIECNIARDNDLFQSRIPESVRFGSGFVSDVDKVLSSSIQFSTVRFRDVHQGLAADDAQERVIR